MSQQRAVPPSRILFTCFPILLPLCAAWTLTVELCCWSFYKANSKLDIVKWCLDDAEAHDRKCYGMLQTASQSFTIFFKVFITIGTLVEGVMEGRDSSMNILKTSLDVYVCNTYRSRPQTRLRSLTQHIWICIGGGIKPMQSRIIWRRLWTIYNALYQTLAVLAMSRWYLP